MITGIRARFPLGIYHGHRPDGEPDLLPSPLRLHAALVAAAGNGSTATEESGGLRRSDAATRALEWLEDNPPEYVELPDCAQEWLGADHPYAYYDEGLQKTGRRRARRSVADATSVAGPLGWGWAAVPEDVVDVLEDLCADVPCLGEADSPVVLEFTEINPTHRRSSKQTPFASVAIRLPVPAHGRLAELDQDYEQAQPVKVPTRAADRWRQGEKPTPPEIRHDQRTVLGYDLIGEAAETGPAAPWQEIVHIAINQEIPLLDRVVWSVALHRALIAALDEDATPLVTGSYPKGTVPPANRVAIQPLSDSLMAASEYGHLGSGLAILLPKDSFDTVATALGSISRLYRGPGRAIDLGAATVLSAASFWKPPAAESVRLWTSVPAVVPETRRQKSRGNRNWTLADSALLSVGFVYRDELAVPGYSTAGQRYNATIDAVEAADVGVVSASLLPDSNVSRYAHKLPKGVLAQPYRLTLSPGSLISDTSLVAIGQSRHLGGGLLCPLDVPRTVAEAWGAGHV